MMVAIASKNQSVSKISVCHHISARIMEGKNMASEHNFQMQLFMKNHRQST
jgi:hypothetical protein